MSVETRSRTKLSAPAVHSPRSSARYKPYSPRVSKAALKTIDRLTREQFEGGRGNVIPSRLLGSGISSDVRLMHVRDTSKTPLPKEFAAKIIKPEFITARNCITCLGIQAKRKGGEAQALRVRGEEEFVQVFGLGVKKLIPNPNGKGKTLAAEEHIVRNYDDFSEEMNSVITRVDMEMLDGDSLYDTIMKGFEFQYLDIGSNRYVANVFTITSCAIQIARAVQKLHALGIVHRDLKPENIQYLPPKSIRQPDGSERYEIKIKVLDFGLSKDIIAEDPNHRTYTRVGTPDYLAPELVAALAYDSKADVYSLGVILWILMNNRALIDSIDQSPMQMLDEVVSFGKLKMSLEELVNTTRESMEDDFTNNRISVTDHLEKVQNFAKLEKDIPRFKQGLEKMKRLSPNYYAAVVGATHGDPTKRWTAEQVAQKLQS